MWDNAKDICIEILIVLNTCITRGCNVLSHNYSNSSFSGFIFKYTFLRRAGQVALELLCLT